ncbi:hypothetical protein AWB80_02855 [Caballeronia pedi]|uniref:Uncharacterized protein n=1 Tax=Caballeronia pedi TaxID=1777141 RepID=A0A158AZD5_9BURK|nr:hypothetical protein [Caballeronia pedi]SAK63351.1 hypothetical protein AWB80_02855 [Caballeronia pedi]
MSANLQLPDEQAQQQVAKAALAAACEALALFEHRPYDGEAEMRDGVRAILTAFAAVQRIRSDASDLHECSFHLDEHHIVASALDAGGYLDLNMVPYSIGGYRYVLFAQACQLLDAMSHVESILQDGELFGGYLADDLLERFWQPADKGDQS